MSGPFIFIGTHRLKDGRFEAFKRESVALVKLVEAEEPRLIAFNVYANEEGNEVTVVQVHPDADSMLTHLQIVHEHIRKASAEEGSLAGTTAIQIFGTAPDDVIAKIRSTAEEAQVSVMPTGLAGFTRSAVEQTAAA